MPTEYVLIVEDDLAIAAFVQTILDRERFETKVVSHGDLVMGEIQARMPDLVILDLMLPGRDGLQLCQAIRKQPVYIPIIMLTAKDDDVDKIVGLEIGADDYITKPFKSRELVARLRATLRLARHGQQMQMHFLCFEGLQIDLDGHLVRVDGEMVNLTPKEYDLLILLASNPGRVFGREMLLERVWGYDFVGESRTVDVHVQRLRRRIEADPRNPRYLITVRNFGYKFEK
jgi:DNA-binding response OmpR family regulator